MMVMTMEVMMITKVMTIAATLPRDPRTRTNQLSDRYWFGSYSYVVLSWVFVYVPAERSCCNAHAIDRLVLGGDLSIRDWL